MRTRFILAFLCLSSVAAGAPQDADARRAAYLEGDRAMVAKDWPAAEKIFEKLWVEGPTYDVALSLGQAEFRQNKYREAAEHIEYAITNYPPREKTDTLQRAKQFLNVATKQIGTLHITVEKGGAEVRIDGEPIGTSPLRANTYVDVGSHVVEARLVDHAPTRQEVTVAAGSEQNVELKFTGPVLLTGIETAGSEPKAGPDGGRGTGNPPSDTHKSGVEARTVALWSGVGVTAVALGIGVGFALKGAAADNRAEEARGTYPPGTCPSLDSSSPCNEIDEALSDRESANKIANVSFIVAGVAAVATATMFFVWPRRHNGTAGHVQIVPIATRDTGGLMVNASF